jgi:acyl-CoA thioester hydrolase
MNEFLFPLKVYVEDTDYAGVVFHSNYLNFFERARSEWIETLGMGIDWQTKQEIYFVIRSAKIDFYKPARLSDRLQVVTRVSHFKRVSMTFEQHLRLSSAPDTILCTAEIRVACLNKQFRPISLPRCKLHEIITGEPV